MSNGPDQGKKVEVTFSVDEEANPVWHDLPVEFKDHMNQFSIDEQKEDPLACLQSIGADRAGQDNMKKEIQLPSESEWKEQVK